VDGEELSGKINVVIISMVILNIDLIFKNILSGFMIFKFLLNFMVCNDENLGKRKNNILLSIGLFLLFKAFP